MLDISAEGDGNCIVLVLATPVTTEPFGFLEPSARYFSRLVANGVVLVVVVLSIPKSFCFACFSFFLQDYKLSSCKEKIKKKGGGVKIRVRNNSSCVGSGGGHLFL